MQNELKRKEKCIIEEMRILDKRLEQSLEEMVQEGFEEIDESWYGPYCSFTDPNERKLEFLKWLSENYYSHRYTCLRRLRYLEEKLNEVRQQIEIQETEIIQNDDLEFIIMMDIRNKNIDIERKRGHYPKDLRWVYKEFFNINIENDKELERAEREGIFKEMMSW